MYEIMPRTTGRRIAIRLRGDLGAEDIRQLRAELREWSWRFGSLALLFVIEEWTGWDGWKALWEDLKADLALNDDVERLAMVGKGPAGRWTTEAMKPFAHAEVRWFPASETEAAWSWLADDGGPAAA